MAITVLSQQGADELNKRGVKKLLVRKTIRYITPVSRKVELHTHNLELTPDQLVKIKTKVGVQYEIIGEVKSETGI